MGFIASEYVRVYYLLGSIMKVDYQQHEYIDLKLRELLAWIETRYGFEFAQTSGYRINNKGVHGTLPLRGWDLRCWDTEVGHLIASQINSAWSYNHTKPDKPTALYHKTKDGGWHLHVQVHANTVLR